MPPLFGRLHSTQVGRLQPDWAIPNRTGKVCQRLRARLPGAPLIETGHARLAPTGKDPAESGSLRFDYRNRRPTLFRRLSTRIWAWATSLGLLPS